MTGKKVKTESASILKVVRAKEYKERASFKEMQLRYVWR